ncbi:beta-hydroxyacyl-ACP dehydratase [Mycoavidus cysteinexigens]|uniref:ApeP family dehydratase n=1 Tax=Mycoavidus cysteinexigens TaxID=1553431 RepID=UPI0032AED241
MSDKMLAMNSPHGFPEIETLLPHRGTMLLLDRVTAFANETLSAEYQVRGDAWYADPDARMPAWIGLELMAQAMAAHASLSAKANGGPPQPGVLLGSRQYQAFCEAFEANTLLKVDVQQILALADGNRAYDCALWQDAELAAKAVLKVFQPPDFSAFMHQHSSSS